MANKSKHAKRTRKYARRHPKIDGAQKPKGVPFQTKLEAQRHSGPFCHLSRYHDSFKAHVYEGWTLTQLARAYDVTEEYVQAYIDSDPAEFPL